MNKEWVVVVPSYKIYYVKEGFSKGLIGHPQLKEISQQLLNHGSLVEFSTEEEAREFSNKHIKREGK